MKDCSYHNYANNVNNKYRAEQRDDNANNQLVQSPQKSIKSYETDQSKRSTEEDELRSLSTTPRMSHEDYGRIVSPPHSDPPPYTDDFPDVMMDNYTTQQPNSGTAMTGYSDMTRTHNQTTGTNSMMVTSNDQSLRYTGTGMSRQMTNQRDSNNDYSQTTNHRQGYSDSYNPTSQHAQYENRGPQVDLMSGHMTNHKQDTRDTRNRQTTNQNFNSDTKPPLANQSSVHTERTVLTNQKTVYTDRSQLTNHRSQHNRSMVDFNGVDDNLRSIMVDVDVIRRDLKNELDQRKLLENQLESLNEDRKDLNMKLATLRIKLGVANANYNVSKTESDQLRKSFQETNIKKARLEERITSTTKELERLKDPNNPDSNVNLKKTLMNDRKEIKQMRSELEGIKSERSDAHKQLENRDARIRQLKNSLGEVGDDLESCQGDFDVAKISAMAERKKREEIEVKYNELLDEKSEFDEKMVILQSQLDTAIASNSGILKLAEEGREKEEALQKKIEQAERRLRDSLTEVEQHKNRSMPIRTASSIKYHQYRMSKPGGADISDTTPHVIVTTNPKGSMAASGYLGKTVVSTKPTGSSLPSRSTGQTRAPPPRGRGGSLPARR